MYQDRAALLCLVMTTGISGSDGRGPGMHSADEDVFSPAQRDHWHEDRHAELCLAGQGAGQDGTEPAVLCNGTYLYRPRQVLVESIETRAATDIANQLTHRGGVPDEHADSTFAHVDLPVRSFLMPPDVHIPSLVTELRQSQDDSSRLNIAPNHVFSGEPEYHGGPAGEPRTAKPFSEALFSPAAGTQAGAQPATIAVLDTGYDQEVQTLHPGLAGRLDLTGCEPEVPVLPTGYLAREAGHGTFIGGIIMRVAPQARIRQVGVLTPAGVTDDQTIALELARAARAGIGVINLSLGGYTSHDEPPLAMALTLAHLTDDVAIVAAAGNNGRERPFWPAAFKRVVSVGALDTRDGEFRRASFSNHGWWVDVYAPGVRILSTYLQATWKLPREHEPRAIDGFAYWSGTSFAAPQVAAMIASKIPEAGSARQAVLQMLAQARWVPGLGPVLIPDATLAG
jgi:subtilisin family serine protease